MGETVYEIADEWVNYKLINHDDCEFNDSAVMKKDDGTYTLLRLGNMRMGGPWSGFSYTDSMQGFEKVLLAVVPPGVGFSHTSEYIQSCVIVKRNGRWGCVSTRFEDYAAVVVPMSYSSDNDVKEALKAASLSSVDYIWKNYEEYIGAGELLGPKRIHEGKKISIFVGDITTLKVDAIVNAANSSLLGGGGIDGAVHRAAGPQLLEECIRLGGCYVGQSKMTDAYNLPCRKIIHTVGPDVRLVKDFLKAADLLASCYNTVLDIASENRMKSVAFCCISTGVFRFPKPAAARIALRTIFEHSYDGEILICCYSEEDKSYYDIEYNVYM